MINIFGWTIVKTNRYNDLLEKEHELSKLCAPQPTLHCGYKSCDFTTKYESGLKRHRTRMHRRK